MRISDWSSDVCSSDLNDVSERGFQLEGTGQWVKGKSADTFGPVGPWLVTPDEVPDPQDLPLWLEVNGQRFQDGSTRTMVFGIDRKSTRLNSSHYCAYRMPSSA